MHVKVKKGEREGSHAHLLKREIEGVRGSQVKSDV
jgi:hypothetical protein